MSKYWPYDGTTLKERTVTNMISNQNDDISVFDRLIASDDEDEEEEESEEEESKTKKLKTEGGSEQEDDTTAASSAESQIAAAATIPGFPPELYTIKPPKYICGFCGWKQKNPLVRHTNYTATPHQTIDLCLQCTQCADILRMLRDPALTKSKRAVLNIELDHVLRVMCHDDFWEVEDAEVHRQAVERYSQSDGSDDSES